MRDIFEKTAKTIKIKKINRENNYNFLLNFTNELISHLNKSIIKQIFKILKALETVIRKKADLIFIVKNLGFIIRKKGLP